MDLLSQTLAKMYLGSSLFAELRLGAASKVDGLQATGSPSYFVRSGSCWFVCPPAAPIRLHAGDMVMVTRWDGHLLATDLDAVPRPIDQVVQDAAEPVWNPGELLDRPLRLAVGAAPFECELTCVIFRLNAPERNPLVLGLPPVLVQRAETSSLGLLMEAAHRFIVEELALLTPGYAVVSNRLADVLFMQIVRNQLVTDPGGISGFLRGLVDRALGRALRLMHEDPSRRWTLAMLAREAGLSRSAFAERFRKTMDTTVADYLLGLRMELATRQLLAGRSVKAVAADCGFSNGHAFSRAFARATGQLPRDLKRAARTDDALADR